MEGKTIFCCEDTVDGIFSAVYDAWASHLGLENVTVEAEGTRTMQLFAQYRQTKVDHEKAAKVAKTIRDRLGMEDYQVLYQAALSREADKGEAIFRTLVLGLAKVKRRNITRNLQDPAVMRVFALSRTVGFEIHRYQMFVRFHELENGVMFSEIAPENQVLPMLGDHFSDRFPMENFMIYDKVHQDCLVHLSGAAASPAERKVSGEIAEEHGGLTGQSMMRTARKEGEDVPELSVGEISHSADASQQISPGGGEGSGWHPRYSTVFASGRRWVILHGMEADGKITRRFSSAELQYAALWKEFVRSIAIEERRNPRCQMNFMPKKYRAYMTEFEKPVQN